MTTEPIPTKDLLLMEEACKMIKSESIAYTYLMYMIGPSNWTPEHDEMFKYFREDISFKPNV